MVRNSRGGMRHLRFIQKSLVAVNFGSISRVLGDEGTLLEHADVFRQPALLGKGLNIAHELRLGDALEGVADPAWLSVSGLLVYAPRGAHLDSRFLDMSALSLGPGPLSTSWDSPE